jgi:hypothetical protein
VKDVEKLVARLQMLGLQVERIPVVSIDDVACKHAAYNTDDHCALMVCKNGQKAVVVWSDDSYVRHIDVLTEPNNDGFAKEITDAYRSALFRQSD